MIQFYGNAPIFRCNFPRLRQNTVHQIPQKLAPLTHCVGLLQPRAGVQCRALLRFLSTTFVTNDPL